MLSSNKMSSLSLPHRNINRDDDAKNPNSASHSGGNSDFGQKLGGLIVVPGQLPVSGESPKLTKLLLNVNIQRSFGPIQVVMSPENTVRELVKAAVETYLKEKRRPLLTETDYRRYQLHYSQFTLESLKAEEKLMNLGSRNFFLCPKPKIANAAANSSSSFCFDEPNCPYPLTNFMDILL